jgi:hypothetical protein
MRDRRVAGRTEDSQVKNLGLLSSWPGGKNASSGPSERAGRGVHDPSDRLLRAKATVNENVLSRGERSARRT